jgi:hypothetical protein
MATGTAAASAPSFLRGLIFGASLILFLTQRPPPSVIGGGALAPPSPAAPSWLAAAASCGACEPAGEADTVTSAWTAQPWEDAASRAAFPFAHSLLGSPRGGGVRAAPNAPFFVYYNAGADFVDNLILASFAHLFRLLERMYGWTAFAPRAGAGWGALLAHSLAARGRAPDVVLFMERLELAAEFSRHRRSEAGAAFASTQVWVLLDDSHWHGRSEGEASAHRAARARNLGEADVIVATYAYTLPKYYPGLDPARVLWLPHAASPEFVRPLNPRPRAAALLAGARSKWYPLRQQAAALAGARADIVLHAHPGPFPAQEGGALHQQGLYVHEPALRNKAARALAREFGGHLACIADGLALWHTIAKLFEIPATGCLLVVDEGLAGPLAWLGFAPGVHYVPFNASSLEGVVGAVLDPARRAAVDEVRRNGQALVLTRHLIFHRAAALHEAALARALPKMPFPDAGAAYDFDIQAKIIEMDS